MIDARIEQFDVIFISGDAYVDHPSFAAAILGRWMQSLGYTVGIIPQPDVTRLEDFLVLGTPKLCCMISGGNIDSMVLHYTADKKKRNDDPYSPGGRSGYRPDRALISYTARAKQAFGKEMPIIIGGIEASLRKFAHYDYWSDLVRRSILLDTKADLLIYGMGELQVREILERLRNGESIREINTVAGTASIIREREFESFSAEKKIVRLDSYETVSERDRKSNQPTQEGKRSYARSFRTVMLHENPFDTTILVQKHNDSYVAVQPPMRPLTQKEFDAVQELPYRRTPHPRYQGVDIPALREVQFSLTSNRGCFGSCSFCAITSHQGRIISPRSTASLVREAESMVAHPDFKGIISDVGGPTANFQEIACEKQKKSGPCTSRFCLYPTACSELTDSHASYLEKLRALRSLEGVKRVFIRSGIRYDYLLSKADRKTRETFMKDLVTHHVSGQLRVAPEHIARGALQAMGKPDKASYEEFNHLFRQATEKAGKEQYCIPYLIAAHPGTSMKDAIELALYLKKTHFIPEQVQVFYPTPGTVATCMYYTGLDPRPGLDPGHTADTMKEVYVPKGRERNMQRALLHFHLPQNRKLVMEALRGEQMNNLIPKLLGFRGQDARKKGAGAHRS